MVKIEMEILIRDYNKEDKKSLEELLSEHYKNVNIDKLENNDKSFSIVAVNDKEVVGHLHIDIINDYFRNIKFGYITYVCVKKAYQNRRIGTYLLERADTIAEDNNLSYYELTSRLERRAAHHLYLKNGFVIRESTIFKKNYRW